MSELRVMTCNVRSRLGDVDVLTAVVRECAPDVLLVQGAPRLARWRSKRAALARRSGLVVATADRPGGVCVMTSLRVDVEATSFAVLPTAPRRPQQAVAGATVRRDGARWYVASVQLGADRQESTAALGALSAAIEAASRGAAVGPAGAVPAVVGGGIPRGLDRLAGAGSIRGLQDCLADDSGNRGAGTLLAAASVEVVSAAVLDVPGSARDSGPRPVLAVLRQARV
jgi:hypothetical protein